MHAVFSSLIKYVHCVAYLCAGIVFDWKKGNYQSFDQSLLPKKPGLLFMGMKQKKYLKNQNGRLKKTWVFISTNSQYFFEKISEIGPWKVG